MFGFNLETLNTTSNAVVLSATLISFKDGMSFADLVNNAIFVKFSVEHQKNRSISKGCLAHWSKQPQHIKIKSFNPAKNDWSTEKCITSLSNYYNEHKLTEELIWCRGGFHQLIFDDLCHGAGLEPFAKFYQFRDFRTAIDILSTESRRGYCPVYKKGFDYNKIDKHDLVHRCAYDIMQLLYFNKENE